MKMRIMAITTFFVVLMMSFGAVSAVDSNIFTKVDMKNSGALKVNIDDPLTLQGNVTFKGMQYDDHADIKVKWADSYPGFCDYYLNFNIEYMDKFGDMENFYDNLYVGNGTPSTGLYSIDYMDLSKPATITIKAEKIDEESGYYRPLRFGK